jgi:RNA polymerase sigma factor (sigma-70 family)
VLSAEHQKLVETHVGLARGIATRMYRIMRGSVELEDLVAHALEGLSEAACRFDPAAATPFGLFAHYRIRGAIHDWLRSMGYLQRRRVRKLAGAPENQNEPAPDESHLARASDAAATGAPWLAGGVSYELPPAWRTKYLAACDNDEEDGAVIVRSPDPLADALVAEKHAQTRLVTVLRRLPGRERSFLLKHYFEDKTMTEAGAELGLSRYQSCRLHARAVAHLREALAAEGFARLDDI